MTIGQRIGRLRKEKKLSQEYLAQQLGVSRQAVSKWETCQTEPDTKNLIALAQLLGVSVEYLATGTQTAPPPAAGVLPRRLRRLGLVLLLVGLGLYLAGLFSGEFNHMVMIPVSETLSVGVPLLWYGRSNAAIGLLVGAALVAATGLLVRLIASWIEKDAR